MSSPTPDNETNRIVVELLDEDSGRTSKKAFEGRFIVGNANNGERFYWPEDSTAMAGGLDDYAVAVTKKNRLVVLVFRLGGCVRFEDFDDFEDLKDAQDEAGPSYPEELIHAVASGLGIEHIEDLDI